MNSQPTGPGDLRDDVLDSVGEFLAAVERLGDLSALDPAVTQTLGSVISQLEFVEQHLTNDLE